MDNEQITIEEAKATFGHLPIERAQMLAQITTESILHNANIEPDAENWEELYNLVLCGFCNGYNLSTMQHQDNVGLLFGHEAELRLF